MTTDFAGALPKNAYYVAAPTIDSPGLHAFEAHMEYVPQHDDGSGNALDPDMLLINEWLAGDLTPAEVDAVEQRLADDQVLFDKVLPHVRVWTSPPLRHPLS